MWYFLILYLLCSFGYVTGCVFFALSVIFSLFLLLFLARWWRWLCRIAEEVPLGHELAVHLLMRKPISHGGTLTLVAGVPEVVEVPLRGSPHGALAGLGGDHWRARGVSWTLLGRLSTAIVDDWWQWRCVVALCCCCCCCCFRCCDDRWLMHFLLLLVLLLVLLLWYMYFILFWYLVLVVVVKQAATSTRATCINVWFAAAVLAQMQHYFGSSGTWAKWHSFKKVLKTFSFVFIHFRSLVWSVNL